MKTLFHFRTFLNELSMDNSRTYKMGVLKKYSEDEVIKYYLDFIFNPYIITGISDKKLNKNITSLAMGDMNPEKKVFDVLEYIKENHNGKDEDILFIQTFKRIVIAQYDTDIDSGSLQKLFDYIITKNLQLGIDAKTINKVIPNLIPTFDVMLANKYFDNPEFVEGKEFALTTKIDGGRIIAIKKNGDVKFYTRSGQLYEGLVDLEEEMKLYMPDNIALDGEITLLNDYEVLYDLKHNEPCIGHKLTSKEQYKETMKITRKDGEKHGVKMLVFDGMSVEDFENQINNVTYLNRRGKLEEFWNYAEKCGHQMTYFELLPILYMGTDTSEITKWLNYNIEHGEEGIMINLVDAPYEFKRSNNLLKVKKMQTMDLQVIGFEEGTNSNQNMLGALLVKYKDGNVVKVGSGYSKELRSEIWNNKEDWLGAIIEIQYFEETENANGGKSVRFPVFKDRRTDKNTPDY